MNQKSRQLQPDFLREDYCHPILGFDYNPSTIIIVLSDDVAGSGEQIIDFLFDQRCTVFLFSLSALGVTGGSIWRNLDQSYISGYLILKG
jgi:hypothetical protein